MSIGHWLGHLHAPTRQYRKHFAKRLSVEDGSETPNTLLAFDESHIAHPRSWPFKHKLFVLTCVSCISAQATYASSVSAATTTGLSEDFGITLEVAQLSTALFFIGFAFGALPVAPLSESFGRHPIYVFTLLIASVFQFGVGAAKNWSTVLACRFFSGLFGAAPLAVAGGSLFDMFEPGPLGYAFSFYAAIGFLAPTMGPIIGTWITYKSDWRYNYYLSGATGCAIALFCWIFCPESLASQIGVKKTYYETKGMVVVKTKVERTAMEQLDLLLFKPFKLIFFEPLLQFLTLYLSVAYFLFFGWLEAYPVVFGDLHHLSLGDVGLCFTPILLGIMLGTGIMMLFGRRYARLAALGPVEPEQRLLPMIVGGSILPIGIFWLGWTSYASVSVWAPIMSGVLFGTGFICIFNSVYQMTIDSYKVNASSALASNVMLRYLVSAGATMAARPMFIVMKPHWACTLLGCVSILMVPIAVLFFYKGASIRARSRYAPTSPLPSPAGMEK